MFNLEGMRALITGGSGGIGFAVTKALSQHGAHCIITGSNEDRLQHCVQRLGKEVVAIKADLGSKDSIRPLMDQCEQLGGIDILINNAGITRDSLALRMQDQAWHDVIALNLTAAFFLTKEVLKGMVKARFGRIISITSVVGQTGNAGQANYAASKAGIVGFSKSLALEVANRNITVNCIAPGFIDTPMTQALSPTQRESVLEKIPVKRMGTPEEIASAAVYLSSKEASYITGATLHINGGMSMQ